MTGMIRADFVDGPLAGKWQHLIVDGDGLPTAELRVAGLLGRRIEDGGVHRCVVYRRRETATGWEYVYVRDEPYESFPGFGRESGPGPDV